MPTAQTLVDELQADAGFDQSDAQVLAWLDRRHKVMVARARSERKTVTIGTTTAGTAFYSTEAAGIIEAFTFEVDDVPYAKAKPSDIWAYSQGSLVWEGQGTTGLVVEDANGSSVTGLTLIPTPEESGLAITSYAAVAATTLELAHSVAVDDEAVEALMRGVEAYGRRTVDQDYAAARELDGLFDAGCEEFRRRVARRFRGSGPAQIRVQGINA